MTPEVRSNAGSDGSVEQRQEAQGREQGGVDEKNHDDARDGGAAERRVQR